MAHKVDSHIEILSTLLELHIASTIVGMLTCFSMVDIIRKTAKKSLIRPPCADVLHMWHMTFEDIPIETNSSVHIEYNKSGKSCA